LKNGYIFQLDNLPPTSKEAQVVSAPRDPVKKAAMEVLVETLLEKDVIKEVEV